MCGIAGYYGQGNRAILEKMTDTLRHRGPDTRGFYIEEKVGLGHRRLSIIDLTPTGQQPMSNENGTVQIIFNGEIYNFNELKSHLKQKHFFNGTSDTEVMLHLYEEKGDKMFNDIQGMFALALYDKLRNKLYLARDRMGKKPLYYGIFGQTLIFGSELKALMMHPLFKKKLDLISLNEYLFYEYIPTPRSIFKNVFKLEPGTYLEYSGKEIKKVTFWQPTFTNYKLQITNYKTGFKNSLEELDSKLNNAVKVRLVSDVPLGIFLSGGIDSSTIAYYAQKNSQQKIKTFSIGFKEKSFDESNFARQAAEYLGTEHHEKIFSATDCLGLIPHITDLLDEPMADPSIVPTYLLSKFTKEFVTVALGGDGGDELFCGYDTFLAHRLAEFYEKIPFVLRKNLLEKIVRLLPTSFSNISFDFKAKSFIDGFYGEKKYRDHRWMAAFDKDKRSSLFSPEIWQELKKENEFGVIDKYLSCHSESREFGTKNPEVKATDSGSFVASLLKMTERERYYQRLIYLYLRMYMMEEILVKVDRASMYNSLEVRAPFLDTAVVDFANSLPVDFKLHGFTTKYILKKLMADKLPGNIVYRKKKGFGMPIAHWFKGELKPLVLELLNEHKIKNEGLFDYKYIKKILADHFSGKVDNRKPIWTLLVFEMWMEKWNKSI